MTLRILFNRETKGIGDLAMMMRSVELTRLLYPQAIIFVRCRYPDLIRNHPALDGIFSLEMSSPPVDLFIDQSKPCAEYESANTPNVAKSRQEIFCDNAGHVLSSFGLEPIEWDGLAQTLWVTGEKRRWGINLVASASGGKVPVGIFWRAAERWRDWDGIGSLAQCLIDDRRFAVFCFDHKDKLRVSGACQIVGYSLDKVLAILSSLRFVVSPDTAGVHLAGGMGVPILGIFGPTDPLIRLSMYSQVTWMPIFCNEHPCWYKPCRKLVCLRRIKARQVYGRIIELLERSKEWEANLNLEVG